MNVTSHREGAHVQPAVNKAEGVGANLAVGVAFVSFSAKDVRQNAEPKDQRHTMPGDVGSIFVGVKFHVHVQHMRLGRIKCNGANAAKP
jgi:hypothetical protein